MDSLEWGYAEICTAMAMLFKYHMDGRTISGLDGCGSLFDDLVGSIGMYHIDKPKYIHRNQAQIFLLCFFVVVVLG